MSVDNSPPLSVVMPVYNAEETLRASVESVLAQSYGDFEFIIINDGSTDGTNDLLASYANKDARISVIHQPRNQGITRSLNKAIEQARGTYIARQDADDYSYPDRLARQMEFFRRHPETVLCGTWFEEVNQGKGQIIRKYPVGDFELRKNIYYVNQFCHPSVVFKKKAFVEAGGYMEALHTGQDFECWMRIQNFGKLANIPEVLVRKNIGFGHTISWQKRKQKYALWTLVYRNHFISWKNVNLIKFAIHYVPLIAYQFIPISILKIVRRFRYRTVKD